ncbi:dual specificity protein phosphatase 3-like isoform X2 [Adelges cooleyi]|nr:dual specificity protein phosphatase 3-like isoform X2 [Adelges cooleyi]XP_050440853.1 dual specificity protein phosphatase 3-like isoform X2 [Adelges cooleyi]XP_050440854.1 dual specificity protein phosphatase 3-like isoform X2 [Adelges cooleyi]XP_050440855.1 dual specificity protein phosphatase 3-like isoform X2 [Adelges cooleyi]
MEYLLAKFCKKDQKKEITLEDLQASLLRTSSPPKKFNSLAGDYDEVYPNLYVGDWTTAKNVNTLLTLGITHVVNAAQGVGFGLVDTNEQFYQPINIQYMGLALCDDPSVAICEYFDSVSNFIDDALSQKGKVLVHCIMGISRSATITIAYLMIKKGMRAKEAIEKVKRAREIRPNDGFLSQLAQLDNDRIHLINQ